MKLNKQYYVVWRKGCRHPQELYFYIGNASCVGGHFSREVSGIKEFDKKEFKDHEHLVKEALKRDFGVAYKDYEIGKYTPVSSYVFGTIENIRNCQDYDRMEICIQKETKQ